MANERKARAWGFIIYPQDKETNEHWLDCLYNTHLRGCISPLHNKDKWSEFDVMSKKEYCEQNKIKVGDKKKPHHHCMVVYNNPTTAKNILTILHENHLENVNYVEPICSIRGSYDYYTHKFNNEKEKYDEKDIIVFNNFNIHDYCDLSSIESMNIKTWLIRFIQESNIYSYNVLINRLIDLNSYDELNCAMNQYNFFNTYLKSKQACNEKPVFQDIKSKNESKK